MPETGQIIAEQLPRGALVALCGEHDVSTASAVKAELAAVLATGGNIVVDLSEATFIDSSIVGALFYAATVPDRIVAVAAAPDTLPRRLIEMVALSATVPTFDSRAAAVAYAIDFAGDA